MKKEARLLRQKAMNSLVLSIEHFNRPSDCGRTEAVLILLDHSFEMLLKSAIIERGGKIREKGAKQTIGFDHCVRKVLSEGSLRFLKEEEALILQAINGLRDAAQHHIVDISESHLYIQAQAGLSLFGRIFREVFKEELRVHLPDRILPISTRTPSDLIALFDMESTEITKLLKPGTRRNIEARAKLRSLAIVDGAFRGAKLQPTDTDLSRLAKQLSSGKNWADIFQGVASINLTTKGYGPSIDLQITKSKGVPITIVPDGTPGATTVAIRRVDELGFYNLGRDQLAAAVGLTGPKCTAFIRYLGLQNDPECHKRIKIGNSQFDRYSQKAIEKIKSAVKQDTIEKVWASHGPR